MLIEACQNSNYDIIDVIKKILIWWNKMNLTTKKNDRNRINYFLKDKWPIIMRREERVKKKP